MKHVFEVKRRRYSVTQGAAEVYLNGERMIAFTDHIEQVGSGANGYGENIDGWQSTTPDEEFIKALLFHPFDAVYHYSEKVREFLDRRAKKCV